VSFKVLNPKQRRPDGRMNFVEAMSLTLPYFCGFMSSDRQHYEIDDCLEENREDN